MKKIFFLLLLFCVFTFAAFAADSGIINQNAPLNPIDAQYNKILTACGHVLTYFTQVAWVIARIVMALCLLWTLLRYAMTGEGLKEAIVKLSLAFIIFLVIIYGYPSIISGASQLVDTMATNSVWNNGFDSAFTDEINNGVMVYHPGTWTADQMQLKRVVVGGEASAVNDISNSDLGESNFVAEHNQEEHTNSPTHLVLYTGDYKINKLTDLMSVGTEQEGYYYSLMPSQMFMILNLAASDAFTYAMGGGLLHPFQLFCGLFMTLAILLTGIIGVLNYFVCFLEYALVTAVGIILLPFMLWDATKTYAEKLIGAMIGFFIKLLICQMCVYFMMWGFLGLVPMSGADGFTGGLNQILAILFTCFLYFTLCTKGPELATSLLTGSPQMNAAGALGAAKGALGAAGMFLGAKGLGGIAAKGAMTGGGALYSGGHAAKSAYDSGAGLMGGLKAFGQAAGTSVKDDALGAASNLLHTLATGRPEDKDTSSLGGKWGKWGEKKKEGMEIGSRFHPSTEPNRPGPGTGQGGGTTAENEATHPKQATPNPEPALDPKTAAINQAIDNIKNHTYQPWQKQPEQMPQPDATSSSGGAKQETSGTQSSGGDTGSKGDSTKKLHVDDDWETGQLDSD